MTIQETIEVFVNRAHQRIAALSHLIRDDKASGGGGYDEENSLLAYELNMAICLLTNTYYDLTDNQALEVIGYYNKKAELVQYPVAVYNDCCGCEDILFVGSSTSGGGGVSLDFNSNRPITRNIAGLYGVILGGTTLTNTLEALLFPAEYPVYVIPTISLSESVASIGEVGEALTNNLSTTFTQNDAGVLTAIKIQKNGSDMTPNGTTSPFTKTDSLSRINGTIAYQGLANYSAGVVKNMSNGNPDPRTPAVRTTSAPEAAETNFASNVVNVIGIYPYFYGKVTTGSRPTANQALINSGTKVIAAASGSITINFNSGSGDYLWFAVPHGTPVKTTWFVNALNTGSIGGSINPGGNLFPASTNVSVDSPSSLWTGVTYDIYISNYQSAVNSNMILS